MLISPNDSFSGSFSLQFGGNLISARAKIWHHLRARSSLLDLSVFVCINRV